MFLELDRNEILATVRTKAPKLFPFVMHLTVPQMVVMFRSKQKLENRNWIRCCLTCGVAG
jgi:hypothetical protein